jgi:hypothetical protein
MFWFRRRRGLSQARLWGLAAGGMLTRVNSEPFDRLVCSCGPAISRAYLSEGWGVNNSSELGDILQWLWDSGHSSECVKMCRSLRSAPAFNPEEPQLVGLGLHGPMAFVASNLDELEASRLVGWDLSRLVQVARWGFTAGYLEEAEAWRWIRMTARRLQQSFPSWEALGRDFLMGYEFWRLGIGVPPDAALEPSYDWLLHAPESPWRRIPWETSLAEL